MELHCCQHVHELVLLDSLVSCMGNLVTHTP